MKHQIIITSIIFLSGFAIFSCSKPEMSLRDKDKGMAKLTGGDTTLITKTINGHSFFYRCIYNQDTSVFQLRMQDANLDFVDLELVITYENDYKFKTDDQVLSSANRLSDALDTSGFTLTQDCTRDLKLFISDLNFSKIGKTVSSGIYYLNAVVNTSYRAETSFGSCECLIHPGFLVDRLPFWCQQDFRYDIRAFHTILDTTGYLAKTPEEQRLMDYIAVERFNNQYVTAYDLLAELESPRAFIHRMEYASGEISDDDDNIDQLFDCDKQGTDLGCCGSYSWCCMYSSITCLYHDLMCLCCNEWHCLPWCNEEDFC